MCVAIAMDPNHTIFLAKKKMRFTKSQKRSANQGTEHSELTAGICEKPGDSGVTNGKSHFL